MERIKGYETVEYHLVYSELIRAARHRGTVTYQELAHVVGLPLRGSHMARTLGQLLGAVSQNEVLHNRPMLSAIAVNVKGEPGDGFFGIAEDLELLAPGADKYEFWQQQRNASYEIWQQQFPKK